MACNIDLIKDRGISIAKEKFIGNSTTMRNNPTNVWVPYGFGRTREQTYKMVVSNANRVAKWAEGIFGKEYSEGWTKISTGFSDGIKVAFEFPKNLENAYKNRNKAEEYRNQVRLAEERMLIDLASNREAFIDEAQRLFQEGDNSLDVQITNLFYNVNLPDQKRRKRIPKLDRLVLKTAAAIGVEVKDMEQYKREYKARTGKELTQLGIADIQNNIIAYSKDDGVTLTEEAMHFIVFANWNTPEIKAIRDLTDPDGNKVIINTSTWQKNADIYTEIYEGDMEKVEKEIIGKILSEYLYDKYENEQFTFKNILLNLLNRFLSVFKIQIRNTRDLDSNQYTKELKDALDIVVENFENSKYNTPFTKVPDAKLAVGKESYFQKVIQQTIRNLENSIVMMEERMIGLVGEDFIKFSNIAEKYGFNIPEKLTKEAKEDLQRIKDRLKDLQNSTNPLTDIQQQELEDIQNYINYHNIYNIDISNKNRVERLRARTNELKKQLRSKKFHAGLYLLLLGSDSKGGISLDIDSIEQSIKDIQDGKKEPYLATYNSMIEVVDTYSPIIKVLNDTFFNNIPLDELNQQENDELREIVEILSKKMDAINRNLRAMAPEVASQHNIKYQELNPEIDVNKKTFTDSSTANLWFGSLKNVKEDWGRLFSYEVNKVKNKINEIIANKGISLIQELGNGVNVDMKLLREYDDSGKPNYYFLSEVKTGLFVKNRDEAVKDAIKKAQEYAKKKYGKQYNIPETDYDRISFFNGISLATMDPTYLSNELKIRQEVEKVFNKEIAIWYDKNTQVVPNVNEIINNHRKTKTKTQFNKWYNANTYTVETEFGEELRFKGELVMPSTGIEKQREYKGKTFTTKTVDYTNPQYERLRTSNPEAFRVLQILKRTLQEHKNSIHTKSYSWERNQLLPQISKSNFDIVKDRDIATARELISETFSHRTDDDYYADRLDGTILKRPPIRYISKLDDPNLITNDLLRSTMMFVGMATNYTEYTKELPKLHGMIDAVNYGEVVNDSTGEVIKDGSESNLSKKMQNVLETLVYGETGNPNLKITILGKEFDTSKVSKKFESYIRGVNLRGNVPSIMIGYLSGSVVAIEEAFLGKFYNKQDAFEAGLEFSASIPELLKDFETPVKTSKIGIVAQTLGIVDNPLESFSNLDKNRVLRAATQMADYGGWRLADMSLKGKGMIAVSKGIRYIDGKWYTKSLFKGSEEQWNNAPRLWDNIDVENGKIKYDPKVTKEAIDIWKVRVNEVNSRLDTQLTETDKALAHNHVLFRFLTIHMGWLYQSLGRGFKPRGFDYTTQTIEEGTWVTVRKLILNPLKLPDLVKDWEYLKPEEKENLGRFLAMMISSSLMFSLAYILNAIALDDDDEDDPVFRYMVYISSRALTELNSRVSPSELLEYITRPVAGLEKVNNFTAPIDFILNFFNEDEEIERGFYAGYSKSEQNFIKSLPLVRGLFENVYGGYINEQIGQGAPSVAVALKNKNEFIKNKVINKNGWLLDFPYGLLSKVAGWTVGRTVAEQVSSQPKSEAIYKLPTKKANKEE